MWCLVDYNQHEFFHFKNKTTKLNLGILIIMLYYITCFIFVPAPNTVRKTWVGKIKTNGHQIIILWVQKVFRSYRSLWDNSLQSTSVWITVKKTG